MGIFVSIGTGLAVLPLIPSQTQNLMAAGSRNISIGLLAGVLNGLGAIAFYKLVHGSNEGLWELSRVAPVVYIFIPVVIAIGSITFFGEQITPNKIYGLIFAVLAIWFLNH